MTGNSKKLKQRTEEEEKQKCKKSKGQIKKEGDIFRNLQLLPCKAPLELETSWGAYLSPEY